MLSIVNALDSVIRDEIRMPIWNPEPLVNIVLALLKVSRDGKLREDEILRMLKYTYSEISRKELLKTLMLLEIRGLIRVVMAKENLLVAELVRED